MRLVFKFNSACCNEDILKEAIMDTLPTPAAATPTAASGKSSPAKPA